MEEYHLTVGKTFIVVAGMEKSEAVFIAIAHFYNLMNLFCAK